MRLVNIALLLPPWCQDGNLLYGAAVYSAAAVFLATQAIVGDGNKSKDGDAKGGRKSEEARTDEERDPRALVVREEHRGESPGADLFNFMGWGK